MNMIIPLQGVDRRHSITVGYRDKNAASMAVEMIKGPSIQMLWLGLIGVGMGP